jgi:ornithine cyclodeaminase/alanine dehydrogenase-like protein (mu-crystallin family)
MAMPPTTLLLPRSVIACLATTRDYLEAMRSAFAGLAEGRYRMPEAVQLRADAGAFHVKSALSPERPALAVVKINGNFPGNGGAGGLPTIQGFIAVLDAERGSLLALMDSGEITARRTAATTALAAGHLARHGSRTLGMVGCGLQAAYHLEALRDVAALDTIRYCDPRDAAADSFGRRVAALGLHGERVADATDAARGADIVVTVTTSTCPLLGLVDVESGTFVAGVGADSPAKHELAPDLLRGAHVVVDARGPAVAGGDLGQAIRLGAMSETDVHAELAQVVTGRSAGRSRDDERWVFDSVGLAVQDHAAAAMILERARGRTDLRSIVLDDVPGAE